MPVVQKIDRRLTAVPAEPADPGRFCKDRAGKPTVCNRDFVDKFDEWRAWARARAKQLLEIAGLHSEED